MPNAYYRRQMIKRNQVLGVYSYASIIVVLIVAAVLLVHSLTSKEQKEIARDEVNIVLTLEQRQAVMDIIAKGY